MSSPTVGMSAEVLTRLNRAEVQFRRLSAAERHELPSPVVNGVELLLAAMEQFRTEQAQTEADRG
jgi:hypothetical protein